MMTIQIIRMLQDFILVQQGFMSMMKFATKWVIPYDTFSEIAASVELKDKSCQKKAFELEEEKWPK